MDTQPLHRVKASAGARQLAPGPPHLLARAQADAVGFIGYIAHDVRNLLNNIALESAVFVALAADTVDQQRLVHGATKTQRQVTSINRCIADLVDLADIADGQLAVFPERVDVTELILEQVATFSDAASEMGIELAATVTPGLVADLDFRRLGRVIAKLLANALAFTPAGGTIAVRGFSDGDELHISVNDSGMGISADRLDLVFEPCWLENDEGQRGLGLGLFVARCCVEAHGGRITVDSTIGRGTTFHLALPLVHRAVD